jgi:hypothetical protein
MPFPPPRFDLDQNESPKMRGKIQRLPRQGDTLPRNDIKKLSSWTLKESCKKIVRLSNEIPQFRLRMEWKDENLIWQHRSYFCNSRVLGN